MAVVGTGGASAETPSSKSPFIAGGANLPGIPTTAFTFKGHRYQFIPGDMAWNDANDRAKDLGIVNWITTYGKLEDETFFDIADRNGMLVLAGWSCCDAWEKWNLWPREDTAVSAQAPGSGPPARTSVKAPRR